MAWESSLCRKCGGKVTAHKSELCQECRTNKCKKCQNTFVWKREDRDLCPLCHNRRFKTMENTDWGFG